MKENDTSWVNIADMMSALMMIFMFISVAFLYQLLNEKEIYKMSLNDALHNEFDKDLQKYKAVITPDNVMRFDSPFDMGSDVIPNEFTKILNDFFPRYIKILSSNDFQKEIDEIRVEGHTSNNWGSNTSPHKSYLYNMKLSQDRANNVLGYCYSLSDNIVVQNINWLRKNLRANGISFSNLLYKDKNNTIIDEQRSRRVEFKVVTKEHFD